MNVPFFSFSRLVEKACALSNTSSLHILLAYSSSISAAVITIISITVLGIILITALVRVIKISFNLVVPSHERRRQSRNAPEQGFESHSIRVDLESHRLRRDLFLLEATTPGSHH